MSRSPEVRARRYVEWIKRHTLAIILAHLLLLIGGLYLVVFRLPLRADFSYLLPQDAPSVRDLRRLESRVKASDTILVVVEAKTPADRAAVVTGLADAIRALPPTLVENVTTEQEETRKFLEANQHLLVPLPDLITARDALVRRIDAAKLAANPLFIELDDEKDPAEEARDKQQLDELQAKRRDAQAKLDRLNNVSSDGRIAIIQVRTPFRATDAGRGEKLIEALDGIRAKVLASHPTVKVGFTGSVITAVAEHRAIAKGMLLSSLITGLLVGLVLVFYFRSATLLALLLGMLAISTVMSFGAAALTVGHLNAATAFLGAIIAGNGVNYGILLIARYLEEKRHHDVDLSLANAIAATLRPTAIASLGAAIAYGSLAATSFKGFADFAIIGAIGMLLIWIATYLLLPALLLRWGRNTRIYHGDPIVGRTLVRVLGFRRSGVVVVVALITAIIASVIVGRYIAADPFEYDIKQLRSEGNDAVVARSWMQTSDKTFGRGISGRTVIAADRLEQVPLITEALRDINKDLPPDHQTIGDVWSIFAFVPDDQQKKLAVLAEIRELLDGALEALDEKERKELAALRPPDDLKELTIASLPPSLRERFTEKDGRVGFLIEIRPSNQLDEWDGRDLIRFATAVRELKLRDGEKVTTSGSSVIFADIVSSIERDGPIVTLIAAAGLTLMVVLLVGFNRRAFAVLIATAAGSLLMVAICALLGIKVNFLDFVALPITLGLGIDYAINIAHRHDHEEVPDPIQTLRTSGSAVFVCSLTTIIGYGSLLISDNLAIRGFGTASLIGEVACVLMALVLVPAILAVGRRRQTTRLPSADQR
ncbi:MAG: putative rane protein [Myxococcales bacterium]|nr:putative rane protein [Myxococcales bacterium]